MDSSEIPSSSRLHIIPLISAGVTIRYKPAAIDDLFPTVIGAPVNVKSCVLVTLLNSSDRTLDCEIDNESVEVINRM